MASSKSERQQKEDAYVAAVLEKKREEFLKLFTTKKGKSILKTETQHQRKLRKARNAALKKLPKDQQKVQRLRNKFEMYDLDGNGTIDKGEFKMMLSDLCISMKDKEADEEYDRIDEDGSGDIEFQEFVDWYEGTGKKKYGTSTMMRFSKRSSSMSGAIDQERAKRALLKTCLSQARQTAVDEFRRTNPVQEGEAEPATPEVDRNYSSRNASKGVPETPAAVREAVEQAEAEYEAERKKHVEQQQKEHASDSLGGELQNMTEDLAGGNTTSELAKVLTDTGVGAEAADALQLDEPAESKEDLMAGQQFFYLDRKGQEVGPIDSEQILHIANEKTFIWFQGQEGWAQIKDVPNVAGWLQDSQWYVINVEKKCHDGPFSLAEVKQRPDYSDSLYVWRKTMDTWKMVKDLSL